MSVPTLTRNGFELTSIEASRSLGVQPAYGPPGPQGDDGAQGLPGANGVANIETVLTAEAIGGGRVITAAGLYTQAGTYNLTLGISDAAAVSGAAVNVRTGGVMIEAAWSWTPGVAIFASPNGLLTQTTPVSGLQRQIARAVSATKIIIDIQPSIALG